MNPDEKISLPKFEWTEEGIEKYSTLFKKNVPVIFDIEHLRRLVGIEKKDFYNTIFKINYQYHEVEIPKKKIGETRKLWLPSIKLKYIQRWILHNILYTQNCRQEITGFVPGKSIVDNARPHLQQTYILKLDIENFFPSINKHVVFVLFKEMGYTKELANTLSNICTYKNELPQGSPSSPYIANLICRRLDGRLIGICRQKNLNYTRYADDITISGGARVYKLKKIFIDIIQSETFLVNKGKVKLLKMGDRKKVTGIIVNEKLSIPKEIIRGLRKDIYYINKFGLDSHIKRSGNINKSNYKEHLYGVAKYIFMVDKNTGLNYFNQLNEIRWE